MHGSSPTAVKLEIFAMLPTNLLAGVRSALLTAATMKMQVNWLLIPAVALSLGACKKKEEVKAPEAPPATAETPAPVVPAPAPVAKAPAMSAEERAAKLGFVRHLPQDTEVVLAFHNGTKTADRVKASKLWKLVQEQMGGVGMGMGAADEEAMEEEAAAQEDGAVVEAAPAADPAAPDEEKEPVGPAGLFGTEFTMALGKTSADQLGNLLTVNRRMGYFQMRSAAKAFVAAMKSGDASGLAESFSNGYGTDLAKNLLEDPESGIPLFEKAKMPPVYLAFKTAEADRAVAAQQVASMVENVNLLGEMVEPVEVETSGQTFLGFKILGTKVSAMMAEDRESMEEDLEAAKVDQLLAAVAKKDIVVVSGTVGDYVLLFFGGSVDDLKLAGAVSESLVATDALAFTDSYASKELAAVVYGQKEGMDTLIGAAGGLADMTNGLRDGLAGADGLGDTRDLEAMFKIVAEREAALRALSGNDSLGMVAFFEEGLKIESYGGTDSGMVDWKATNKLAPLGDSEDLLMFANVTADAAYDEKARAYFEALLETAYAMTMKVAEAPVEGEQMAQFKAMAAMFDGKFRPDMVALWDAFGNDFGGGLGHESALVVDLKGGAPAVPGIPQAVVDKAKVPRISIVSPVTDRAKLAGSWDKMNTTLTGTLAKVSEMTGQEIPMQKPISSERSGNTTWFFPMPFFTDDFLPSVTVGDKWFVASTSKNQALDLIAKADGGGATRDGLWFSMNFKTLEKYAQETSALIDENAEALMGAPLTVQQKKTIKNAIAVLGDLDSLTAHSRREAGVLRSSVHFKTR
jgi:hypothetical protein